MTSYPAEAVMNASLDGIILADSNGVIRDINAAGAAMFGYVPHDLLGRSIETLMPQREAVRHQGHMDRYFRTGEARLIGKPRALTALHRDGHEFPIMLSLSQSESQESVIYAGVSDMSDAARMRRALLAERHKLATILAALPDAVMIYRDRALLYANPAFFDMTGFRPDGQDMPDLARLFGFVSDNRDSGDAQASPGLDPARRESVTFRRADGALRHGAVKWTRLEDYDGEPATLAVLRDVSEQTEAYARLREREEWFSLMFNSAELIVVAWDMEFRATYWNQAAERVFGYTHEDMTGRHAWDLIVPPDVGSFVEEVFRALLAGEGSEVVENDNVTKDGRRITVRWHNTVLHDAEGRAIGVASIAEDISDRIETQRQLRLMDLLARSTLDMIVVTDASEAIEWVNPAFERATGYLLADIRGRHVGRLLQGDETSVETRAEIRAALGRGEAAQAEILNYDSRGQAFWNELIIQPILGSDGRVSQFFSVQRDVTERRMADRQISHLRKMEALGQMTGGLVHDFNNIMVALHGNLLLARDALANADAGTVDRTWIAEMLDRAIDADKRALKLTDKLLEFARNEPAALERFRIGEEVEGLRSLLQSAIGKGIRLGLEDRLEGPVEVCLDRAGIEATLMNFAINSHDAMEGRGELRIVIDAAPSPLRIDGEQRDPSGYVALSVIDDGSGIDPALIDRVMEPYFTTKARGDGTGLGLSTAFRFARRCGGTLEIASSPGKGTRVTLVLPRSDGG